MIVLLKNYLLGLINSTKSGEVLSNYIESKVTKTWRTEYEIFCLSYLSYV